MENEVKLAAGAVAALAVATAALVVLPYMQVRDIAPPDGLKPYTSAELRGRAVYVANGCVYCHTQQPRDRNLGPDHLRGWGRASVPGDYYYDKPHRARPVQHRRAPAQQRLAPGPSVPATRLHAGFHHAGVSVYVRSQRQGRTR